MILNDTLQVENFFQEVSILKQRSKLLDILLSHYNHVEGKFEDVPAEWKDRRVRADKLPAANPREFLKSQVEKHLDPEEIYILQERGHELNDKNGR